MLELRTPDGKRLDLPRNLRIRYTWENNVFSKDTIPGFRTESFTVPLSPHNVRILGLHGYATPGARLDLQTEVPFQLWAMGALWRSGLIKVWRVLGQDVELSFYADSSNLAVRVKDKKLQELELLGDISLLGGPGSTQQQVYGHATGAVNTSHPVTGSRTLSPYTFTQLVNPDFYDSKVSTYTGTVNEWQNGSGILQPYQDPSTSDHWFTPLVPFPYAFWLFRQIFAEHGVEADITAIDDEMRGLTIYNLQDLASDMNAPGHGYLDPWDYQPNTTMRLQDHLPEMGVREFLQAIKKMFALSFLFDKRNAVRVVPFRDIARGARYTSLDGRVYYYRELENTDYQGYRYATNPDPDDATTETDFRSLAGIEIVDTVEDIIAVANYPKPTQGNKALYVKSKADYWTSYLDDPAGPTWYWEPYSHNYYPYSIDGGGEEFNAGFGILSGFDNNGRCYARQVGSTTLFELGKKKAPLRFFWDRGFMDSAPYVNCIEYDIYENKSWNYALRWEGEAGLVHQFHRQLNAVYRNGARFIASARLKPHEVLEFDFTQRYRIRDVNHWVERLEGEITQHGLEPVELHLRKAY